MLKNLLKQNYILVKAKEFKNFEPTYEELKPSLTLGTIEEKIYFEPTYEELKHKVSLF